MKLIFATNNLNKLAEIRELAPNDINILSLDDINCVNELPETKDTLEGNAMQKADFIFRKFGFNCFADDTGLEIEALNGEPGVYSARYASLISDANKNISKVLSKLQNKKNRRAQFRTVIALIINGKKYYFEGKCKGHITTHTIGEKGFGYDPIFIPNGFDNTFAQMSKRDKNLISHRGNAVRKLIEFLSKG